MIYARRARNSAPERLRRLAGSIVVESGARVPAAGKRITFTALIRKRIVCTTTKRSWLALIRAPRRESYYDRAAGADYATLPHHRVSSGEREKRDLIRETARSPPLSLQRPLELIPGHNKRAGAVPCAGARRPGHRNCKDSLLSTSATDAGIFCVAHERECDKSAPAADQWSTSELGQN